MPIYRNNEYGHIAQALDEMSRRLNDHITREYKLELLQRETMMKALQNQINPHFLYNSLEVIRSSVLMEGGRQSAESLAVLGALFRELVNDSKKHNIRDELALVEKYLKIMRLRNKELFTYRLEVDERLMNIPTAKFWMQPLVENFFIHGFTGKETNLLIIKGMKTKEGFEIMIINNGESIPQDKLDKINAILKSSGSETAESGGIGLSNTRTRLGYFYGEELTVFLENNPDRGITVKVIAPLKALNPVLNPKENNENKH
jgi:sensor histidine kinase YesM